MKRIMVAAVFFRVLGPSLSFACFRKGRISYSCAHVITDDEQDNRQNMTAF